MASIFHRVSGDPCAVDAGSAALRRASTFKAGSGQRRNHAIDSNFEQLSSNFRSVNRFSGFGFRAAGGVGRRRARLSSAFVCDAL
jgi:hypothetical protein